MRIAAPDDILPTLLGREIVAWGGDDEATHLTLDDGRILVFVGLGVVTPPDKRTLQ